MFQVGKRRKLYTALIVAGWMLTTGAHPGLGAGRPPRDVGVVLVFAGASAVAGDGRTGSIALTSAGLELPVTSGRAGSWSYALRARGGAARLETGGLAPGNQSLYSLSLPVSATRGLGADRRLLAVMDTGLAGDWRRFRASDLQLFGLLLAVQPLTPELELAYGLIYSEEIGPGFPLPVAGLTWRPHKAWTVDLVMPEVGVTYAPTRALAIDLYAGLQGDSWRVHPDDGTPARTVELDNLLVGLGLDIALGPRAALRLQAGWATAREFTVGDATIEPDDTLFAGCRLSLR